MSRLHVGVRGLECTDTRTGKRIACLVQGCCDGPECHMAFETQEALNEHNCNDCARVRGLCCARQWFYCPTADITVSARKFAFCEVFLHA